MCFFSLIIYAPHKASSTNYYVGLTQQGFSSSAHKGQAWSLGLGTHPTARPRGKAESPIQLIDVQDRPGHETRLPHLDQAYASPHPTPVPASLCWS